MFDNAYWSAMYRFLMNGSLREYLDVPVKSGIRGAIISMVTAVDPHFPDYAKFMGHSSVRFDIAKNVMTDYWRVWGVWSVQ